MVCSVGAIMGGSGFGSARSKLYRTVYMTVKENPNGTARR
jgi:hypothetical protein